MSEPFIAQITMFGGNFAPRGWAFCDGQLLSVSSNTALFSLLGTTYGGDGRTTFALPDLRGRFPMHAGTGPGLTPRTQGQKSGTESHNITVNQLPAHNHNLASSNEGEATSPAGNILAVSDDRNYVHGTGVPMGPSGNTGGGQAVNHMPPFVTVRFIIALVGIYPSRD